MNRIIVLNVKIQNGFSMDVIHPVVLMDDKSCVLVDCGCSGSFPFIEDALRENKIRPDKITHILLTHHDHDHIGGVAEFKRKFPIVKTMASEIEAPYMTGERKSLRLEQAELLQESLPLEQEQFGIEFCELLRRVELFEVDHLIKPGETLDFCGGCVVLDTKGHLPGHISLYLKEFDTLITADAMALEQGKPIVANIQYALNPENAIASFHQLMSLKPRKMICYHGGVYRHKEHDGEMNL